jgi:hypothetical protein
MIARGACFGSAAGEDDLRVLAQWLRDCAALEDVGDDPTKPSRGSLADMTELWRSDCRKLCRSEFLVASRRAWNARIRLRTDSPGRTELTNEVQADRVGCHLCSRIKHI